MASTYWDNLRTSGKCVGSGDAYDRPTASSWCTLCTGMGLGSSDRDATVDSRNIGNCVDGFE